MERKNIKKALISIGYKADSIKSIMCGRALPSMSKAIALNTDYGVPLEVWVDIRSYLKNDTKEPTDKSNTNQDKKVSA